MLRKIDRAIEWWLAVEVAPGTYRVHVHGYLKGKITEQQFKAAATAAGLGRVNLDHVPAKRANLAKHYAYPTKSIASADPIVRSEFVKWNARGSQIGFYSSSRGFFNNKECTSDAANNKESTGSDEDSAVDAVSPPVRLSQPLQHRAPTTHAAAGSERLSEPCTEPYLPPGSTVQDDRQERSVRSITRPVSITPTGRA
jgi:hypothetical protein